VGSGTQCAQKLESDIAFSAQNHQKLRKAYLALFPLFPLDATHTHAPDVVTSGGRK
jgi:hypothetical protein